jgi:hypothetical protein
MVLAESDTKAVGSLTAFRTTFDVSAEEIAEALPEPVRRVTRDMHGAESIHDVPAPAIFDAARHDYGVKNTIQTVLKNRESVYTYRSESPPTVHYITEITDE